MSTQSRQSSSGTQYGPSPSTAVTSPTGSATAAVRTPVNAFLPHDKRQVNVYPDRPRSTAFLRGPAATSAQRGGETTAAGRGQRAADQVERGERSSLGDREHGVGADE